MIFFWWYIIRREVLTQHVSQLVVLMNVQCRIIQYLTRTSDPFFFNTACEPTDRISKELSASCPSVLFET